VFWKTVGFGQGFEYLGILLNKGKEFFLKILSFSQYLFYLLLNILILFLSQGEVANHASEGNPQCPCHSGSSAAAGNRGRGRQESCKFPAGFFCEHYIHLQFS